MCTSARRDRPGGPPRARPGVVLLATALVACRPEPSGAASTFAGPAATVAPSSASSAPNGGRANASLAAALSTEDWRQAARMGNWARATELLQALPKAQRRPASTRLALGVCALHAGRHATAVAALEGLQSELPMLADRIARWWAEAAAVAGPHARAAAWLARSAKVKDLLLAAKAMRRAGELRRARALADRAVKRARRTRRRRDEMAAHRLRATLANEAHDVAMAATDWRWLVDHAEGGEVVHEAITGLDRVGGRLPISARLDALARATTTATLEATLLQLGALAKAHPADAAAVALAKARALYRARAFARAAKAFTRASALPTGHTAEARYLAVRCAERAGETKAAIDGFREVARRFAASGWAERARFRVAELLLRLGKHGEAAAAFTRYLSRHGQSKWAPRAQQGRALALLGAGKPAKARAALATLRRRTTERRLAASWSELEGVAALRAGDRAGATRLWMTLLREQPLTWPAIAARARLVQAGVRSLPPLLPPTPGPPALPLAAALPAVPRLLHGLGLEGAAERALASSEQQAAQGYPGRESEALCAMYGQLGRAARRYRVGNKAVSLEQLMRAPPPAERWAWQCVYPTPYRSLTRRIERQQALPTGLLHAVMRQESAFDPEAVSPAGAVGLMQLMPATAAQAARALGLQIDPQVLRRPDVSIAIGAHYLQALLKRFAGSLPLVVASYNAGPHAVSTWLLDGSERQIDLWVARIPYRETRHYVARVLANLARYQWLAGGATAVAPLGVELPKGALIEAEH